MRLSNETQPGADDDTNRWLHTLRGPAAVRADARTDLRALLLRAARHEFARRREAMSHVPSAEIEALATQSAEAALAAVLATLGSFPAGSRFTTWASKFAVREAAIQARRRAWRDYDVSADIDSPSPLERAAALAETALGDAETRCAFHDSVRMSLTAHEREVFIAVAVKGVPIDVLAEHLGTTRQAAYQTLHDARFKVRLALADSGR